MMETEEITYLKKSGDDDTHLVLLLRRLPTDLQFVGSIVTDG